MSKDTLRRWDQAGKREGKAGMGSLSENDRRPPQDIARLAQHERLALKRLKDKAPANKELSRAIYELMTGRS